MLHWLLGLAKGYDWRGRMKFLVGRTADPAQCQVPNVDARTTEQALDILGEAFLIPPAQRYCLRPTDVLREIYWSITRLADRMEFETLLARLEEACGREISEEEFLQINTVGDVIRFLANHPRDCPCRG